MTMKTINSFEMMEPMKYYDNPEPSTESAKQKRQNIIDNKDNLYIASEKHDGDWGMFIHYSEGKNLIRSRSISKVTGKYGDMTEKLPHLVEEMNSWPENTVVLAEICWNEYGTNANTVGTILRCLPPKAVERQKNKKLVGKMFDILMLDGTDLTSRGYEERLGILDTFAATTRNYFSPTAVYRENFAEKADEIISQGGEGLVIQLKTNPYMEGTRTAWKTLKLKQCLPHMELLVVDTIKPNKNYEGNFIDNWKYWEINGELVEGNKKDCTNAIPVTKPYYMGWKNGVIVDFNGVKVSVTSGLSDEDREWLASDAAKKSIENGELYAEVKAMSVNDLNSLRHPALVRLRNDVIR